MRRIRSSRSGASITSSSLLDLDLDLDLDDVVIGIASFALRLVDILYFLIHLWVFSFFLNALLLLPWLLFIIFIIYLLFIYYEPVIITWLLLS